MIIKKSLGYASNLLINIQKIILIISFSLIVIGLGFTVFMRYFIQADIPGFQEIIIIPALWLYFIGASYGSYSKYHISVDLIDTYIKNKKVLSVIQLLTTIISSATLVIMTYWSFEHIFWSFSIGSKSSHWNIPEYVPHLSIFIGLLLMTGYILRDLFNKVLEVISLVKQKK